MDDKHLEGVMARNREEAEWLLPVHGGSYHAFGRPANRPLCTLHFALGKEGYRSYPFMSLDGDSRFTVDGKGHVIVLRFAGMTPVTVTIRGRNLARLYDYIHQHRTPWVMRIDEGRDFVEGDEPVVTGIEIEEIKQAELR